MELCTLGSQTFKSWICRAIVEIDAPRPAKKEEDLLENVEMWQDKMMRLEAHGDGFELAPVF